LERKPPITGLNCQLGLAGVSGQKTYTYPKVTPTVSEGEKIAKPAQISQLTDPSELPMSTCSHLVSYSTYRTARPPSFSIVPPLQPTIPLTSSAISLMQA
jgi:hypothetical protein